jgi:hypothetical protein
MVGFARESRSERVGDDGQGAAWVAWRREGGILHPAGSGRHLKKYDCDLDTTWSLLENSISENEPKFDQAGVEKLGKQSQKRTQVYTS